jgi:hypothetical protein
MSVKLRSEAIVDVEGLVQEICGGSVSHHDVAFGSEHHGSLRLKKTRKNILRSFAIE